jgi:hypothetical protein
MTDEKKGIQFQDAEGKTYKAVPIGVRDGDAHAYDVTLDDGSVLRLRVIILSALKAEGYTDPAGQPVYQVNTLVVPMVKKGPTS